MDSGKTLIKATKMLNVQTYFTQKLSNSWATSPKILPQTSKKEQQLLLLTGASSIQKKKNEK